MKKSIQFIFLCLIILSFGYADQVLYVKGQVVADVDGKKVKLNKGDTLPEGAVVETGSQSTVVLKIGNKTKVKADASSKLSFKKKQSRSKKTQIELQLLSGSVFSKLNKLDEGETFEVKTPVAVAGVRGTEFYTAYNQAQSSTKDMWMCVREGQVALKNSKDNKEVLVNQGEGVLVTEKGKMTNPKPVDWTNDLLWNMDPDAGEVENQTTVRESYRRQLLEEDYE